MQNRIGGRLRRRLTIVAAFLFLSGGLYQTGPAYGQQATGSIVGSTMDPAGEQVTVTQGGHNVVRVICDGPWLLFKLAPGEYRVSATLDGKSAESIAHAPKSGQGRITLRFDLGGAVSPEDRPSNQ